VVKKIGLTILLVTIFLGYSCSLFHPSSTHRKLPGATPGKLAVVGFEVGLTASDKAKAVRDPISGSVFMAEPVRDAQAQELSRALYELLSLRSEYVLIPLAKVRDMEMNLEVSRPGLLQSPKDFYIRVGQELGADWVLVGYLYRWRERKGEAYGVKRAASVAFSLSLISVKDKTVAWSDKFDKTQRSLAENLLDLITFLRGKGRWMSAKELALMGLEKLVKEIP